MSNIKMINDNYYSEIYDISRKSVFIGLLSIISFICSKATKQLRYN